MRRHGLIEALILLALAGPAGADHDERGVTLYRDVNYEGDSQTFYDGDEIPRFESGPIGNDSASSLRVGRECQVTLYEHVYFRGGAFTYSTDVADLRFAEIGNDRASSLRVECRRPGYRGDRPGGERGVKLYADDDFRGREEVFEEDDPDLSDNYVRQGTVSSVRVPTGCEAVLYDGPYYRGDAVRVREDVPDMRLTRIGNDRVASLKVECHRRPGWYGDGGSERPGWYRGDQRREEDSGDWGSRRGVALYSDSGFQGHEEFFFDDDPDLYDNPIRQDTASSVRVAPGCSVTIYEHPNYEGRSATLREDMPDLGRSWIGNDAASSVRVDCQGSGRRR